MRGSDFFSLTSQTNPRQMTPLHRSVLTGNFLAMRALLASPLFAKSNMLREVDKEIKQNVCVDVSKLDIAGRCA